jgi:hypothetical protein
VLFSRSDDYQSAAAVAKTTDTAAISLPATNAEREALSFLSYDLDVHLVPSQQSLGVRARMTVRNDGDKPLRRIALQISSSLHWERVVAGGAEARFAESTVATDSDHTGAVSEAVATLPRELAPKEELPIEVFYHGTVPLTGKRLEPGVDSLAAERLDWDRIAPEFVGLRGFGYVIWYPVSARPMRFADLQGEGRRERQAWERRQWPARVKIALTLEYAADAAAPNVAVLDGQVVPVVPAAAPANSFPGVVTASLPESPLGFSPPSLFLLNRQVVRAGGGDGSAAMVLASAEDLYDAQHYASAIGGVEPLVRQWLGPTPKTPMVVLGLPDALSDPEQQGPVFTTGMRQGLNSTYDLPYALTGSLAHAWFRSPRAWLNEGVPQFVQILAVEQAKGRRAALETLAVGGASLAMVEPATPGAGADQSLLDASDSFYFLGKSAYVLWMLREMVGDAHLAAALQAYVPEQDTTPEYFEGLVEKASGKDLKWFFEDWVYHDRGLPDLAIAGVFATKSATEGQWLVAVDLVNNGYAEVEVPVTVRSKDATVTERMRLPAQGKASRRILIGGQPVEVQLNDGSVPEVRQSEHLMKLTVGVK